MFSREKMAGWTGLEPAAFRVTGGRYNQLNYHPTSFWKIRYSHHARAIQQDFSKAFTFLGSCP